MNKTATLQNKLLEEIRSGALRCGDAIPSRTWLCRKYQLSRNTVDRAIGNLAAEGYLSSQRGGRTVVRSVEKTFGEITSINATYMFRRNLGYAINELFVLPEQTQLPIIPLYEGDVPLHLSQLMRGDTALIWYHPRQESIGVMQTLEQAGVPQILVNRTFGNWNYAAVDTLGSLRKGMRALLDCSEYKELTLFSRPPVLSKPYLSERLLAFHRCAAEFGVNLRPEHLLIRDVRNVPVEVAEAAHKLFTGSGPARNIVLLDLEFALPLITAALALGVKPGRDFRLLMFDRLEELDDCEGVLMLDQHFEEHCRLALEYVTSGAAARREKYQRLIEAELMIGGVK